MTEVIDPSSGYLCSPILTGLKGRRKWDYQSPYRKGFFVKFLSLHFPVGYRSVFIIHEKQWLLDALQVGASVISAEQ